MPGTSHAPPDGMVNKNNRGGGVKPAERIADRIRARRVCRKVLENEASSDIERLLAQYVISLIGWND